MTKSSRPLKPAVLALIGGSVIGSSAHAGLLAGDQVNLQAFINGALVLNETPTIGSGWDNASGAGWMSSWEMPASAFWSADIYYNFEVSFQSVGTTVDMVFSDLDFDAPEIIESVTLSPSSSESGTQGPTSVSFTDDSVTISFVVGSTFASSIGAFTLNLVEDTGGSVPAAPTLALLGLGLFGVQRRWLTKPKT